MYMISTKRFAPLCFVLLLTLVALAAGALCLPAAAAAETPSAGDYMVTKGGTLTLYDGNNQPVLEVPATYYVTLKSAEATGGCYSVAYAGKTYSVKTADFTARTALHNEEKYGAVPAENKYYAFDKSAVFAADAQLTFYLCKNGAIVAETVNGAGSSVTEIYGLVTIGGSVYYSVSADTSFTQDMTVYVASSQASGEFASLTPAGIAANPYESVKAEKDAQTAGVSDQDGSNGSADASDPADTSNNLERIILSVVIAVLCVAVVLLIFRPGAKKKQ